MAGGYEHKKKHPRPRLRTDFPRTDSLEAKDRIARGQDQGPRTQRASVLQKKRSSRKNRKFSDEEKKVMTLAHF